MEHIKVNKMKYFFSLNKLIFWLRNIIEGKRRDVFCFKNSIENLKTERKRHKECLRMFKEVNLELTNANVLLNEEMVEKDILICYNKIFSSICKKITV